MNKNDIAIGKPNSAWETIFPQFVQQIEKFTGKDYANQLRADFSTSTADSKIISEIILMESVKSYFDYRVMFIGCGISKVILEGELADWDNILQKINYIFLMISILVSIYSKYPTVFLFEQRDLNQ